MSAKPAFEDDDVYDFDYLNEGNIEPCRPKLKPKGTREVIDNKVKLPPVLVGLNVAAMNEATKMKTSKRAMTISASKSKNAEIDWHKERQKLNGPRQPQKENTYRPLEYNEPCRKTKLPKINDVFVKPTSEQTHRIGQRGKLHKTCQPQMVLKSLEPGKENLEEEQKTSYQALPPTMSPYTSTPVKEFTYQERRPHVRFANNTEMNQDVSVHNECKPFYKPRPKTPYEIDYEEEIRQATELSRGLEELHRELQNKGPMIRKRRGLD